MGEVKDVPVGFGKGVGTLRLQRVRGQLLGEGRDFLLVGGPVLRPTVGPLRRALGFRRFLNIKHQR